MNNDEKFLRDQIRLAIGNQKVKFFRELNEVQIHDICNAGVNRWAQGDMRGLDAVKFALRYAKDNYKTYGR